MKQSLLGHLYSHIKGSAEDVATMSLQYIITYYESLNRVYNELMAHKLHCDLPSYIEYECQSIGDEYERPDMAGRDSNGNEVILCEAKFYAGLTANQPLTYLERLRKENGAGLVFICPKERIVSLWDTLLTKCENEDVSEISQCCISVNGTNMAIVSWEETIGVLQMTANTEQKDSCADVEQLEGYCEQIMSEAFIPFKEEDLGAITARKYERYMYIADLLVNTLAADFTVELSTDGLKATPYRHGYKRFFMLNGLAVDFRLDLELWADDKYADTPFWVSFRGPDWNTPECFREAAKCIPATRRVNWTKGNVYLAVDVPCNAMEEDVVSSIKAQMLEYLRTFEHAQSDTRGC
ncbi:MAG: hypothetical protein E7302_10345 [Butyrivibrio sp.]|nr:hypothetical protein [Butyrivibrio sp.]